MKKLLQTLLLLGRNVLTARMSSIFNFPHHSLYSLVVDFFNAGTRAAVSPNSNFKNQNLFQS